MKKDMVIFENGKYNCEFINPALSDAEVSDLRNGLRSAFKAKTGVTPSFKGDDKSAADAGVFELLLGNTNRPESADPAGVVEGADSFYTVAVIGNKIVINGSDSYQLEKAVEYFIENYLAGDPVETLLVSADLSEQKILKDFARDYWKLYSVPAYSAGVNKLVPNVYSCGTTIMDLSTANRNKSDVNLQSIRKTNATEFEAYLAKLESFGYQKEYENRSANGNAFLTYKNEEQRVHVSYKPGAAEVQVICDPKGISLEEFGYSYTPKTGERSEYYLYGIPMTDCNNNGHPNCGMLMVIKCADNSVIIVDGGEYEGDGGKQVYEKEVMDALDDFLHQITGTAKGGKVRVSAWYVTHYHSDHTRGLLEFFKRYGDHYELERVIGNIPIENCGGSSNKFSVGMTNWSYGRLDEWNNLIQTKYPNCKEIKVHSGQKIQIADVSLEVIYTHEDLLNDNGRFNSTDSNDTSTVIRADNGLMSMMILGDSNSRTESRIRKTYTPAMLKSDIVQAAHHMIYDVEALYKDIQPTIAYIPQSFECAQSNSVLSGHGSYKERFDKLTAIVGDRYYCAGNETVGYAVIDGQLKECYHVEGVVGRKG